MSASASTLYARFVNPEFAELLRVFDYGRDFVRAHGTRLYDEEGREYLDFLAGYGVHNIGHNHPHLLKVLHETLDGGGSSMLSIDAPGYRAELAERLNALTHPDLCRTVFANSGAEAVDIAIRTARAATGRRKIVACSGGFHGLSVGAGALLDAPTYSAQLAAAAGEVELVPFGDADALDAVCRRTKAAAFVVEPVQGEGGIRIPPSAYLADASAVCRRHGCLLVVDEIQTGLGRTGTMFATPLAQLVPDVLLLGKALSGGVVPVAVAMMTPAVWKRSFGTPWGCTTTSSTFAGGRLAVAAASATLAVLEAERLPGAAAERGDDLAARLRQVAGRHAITREVRQRGLLIGIEFQPACGVLMKAVPAWARDGLYTQVLCALLLRDHGILAQPCSIAPNVLRVEPPLTVTGGECEAFAAALDAVLGACPDHGTALAGAFRRRVFGGQL